MPARRKTCTGRPCRSNRSSQRRSASTRRRLRSEVGAERRGFIDQRAAGIAVDAGGREIADPAQGRGAAAIDVAVLVEDRIARLVGRHRAEHVGDPVERRPGVGQRPVPVEPEGAERRRRSAARVSRRARQVPDTAQPSARRRRARARRCSRTRSRTGDGPIRPFPPQPKSNTLPSRYPRSGAAPVSGEAFRPRLSRGRRSVPTRALRR